MKACLIQIDKSYTTALEFILESLSICAQQHSLSKELLDQFCTATGPITAVVPPWINVEHERDFAHGSNGPPESGSYEEGWSPRGQLMNFVQRYLQQNVNHVVICENFGWTRKHTQLQPWSPSRMIFLGEDEVFHVLTSGVSDPEQIEATIVARHHWQTGVCSACAQMPEEEILDISFFEEIVNNTSHLFVPAFDGSGYLIWSPMNEIKT